MAMDMNVALKIRAGVNGQQSVDQLRTSMDKLDGAASGVSRGFNLAKAALGAFLGLQAVQGITQLIRGTAEFGAQVDRLSTLSGIGTTEFQRYAAGARLVNIEADKLSDIFKDVRDKVGDFLQTGGGPLKDFFENIAPMVGVTAEQFRYLSGPEALQLYVSSLEKAGVSQNEMVFFMEALANDAALLTPLLRDNAAGFKEAGDEAERLGMILDEQTIQASKEFNTNMIRVGFQLRGMANTIVSELLPSMDALSESMLQNGKSGGGLELVATGIRIAFETLVVVGGNMVYVLKQIGNEAIGVAKQMAALATLDFDGFDRIGTQMREDAIQARKDIDAWSESILTANQRLKQTTPSADPGAGDAAARRFKSFDPKAQAAIEKEAAAAAKERAQVLQGLNDEIVKLTQGEEALVLAKLRSLGASDAEIRQAETLMRQKAGLVAADRELEEATKEGIKLTEDATRAKEQLAAAGKQVFEETRTPIEKLNMEITRLDDLLAKGAISWDTYGRAIFDAQEDFDSVGVKGKDTMQQLTDAIDGWGKQATDAFVDFAFTGKMSFSDMVSSILKDIARMVFQTLVMAPLMAAIKTMLPTAAFANGGIMTGAGPAPLKKYANGGVANTPQLALYGEGSMPEAYVPLPDGRTIPVTMKGGAGGGGANNVTVNVNVESGSTDQTSTAAGAAQLGKAIAGAVRMELMQQKRPGGLLA